MLVLVAVRSFLRPCNQPLEGVGRFLLAPHRRSQNPNLHHLVLHRWQSPVRYRLRAPHPFAMPTRFLLVESGPRGKGSLYRSHRLFRLFMGHLGPELAC